MAEHIVAIGRVRATDVSVGHTLDLVQQVAIDRLRILQVDLEERARAALRRSTWIVVGLLCLVAAWVGLLAAAVFALAERIPLPTSLLLVATSQLLIGAGLIAWGRRQQRA